MSVSKMFLIFVSMSTWYCCSTNRVKRIINGFEIEGREGPYDVIKYAVAIGDVHTKPWWTLGLYFRILAEVGVYGKVYCGGVLLTPAVVQTACHCIADFEWVNRRKQSPRVNHQWEDKRVIYVGVNNQWDDDSMMTTPYLESREYVTHESCAKIVPVSHKPHELGGEDNNGGAATPQGGHPETITTHDFGLIKVRDPRWVNGQSGVPTTNVAYAPLYTSQELESIVLKFSALQPVCLNVGWGNIDWDRTDTDSIRGGWTQMMSIQDCVDHTATNKYGWPPLSQNEIEKYMTWICTRRFPQVGTLDHGGTGPGDSGDPVTCNNAFVGIVRGAFKILEPKGIGDLGDTYYGLKSIVFDYSAIVFSQLENASNYRRYFDRVMSNLFGVTYRDIMRELTDRLGDNFVEHLEEEILEEAFEHVIQEAAQGIVIRSGNQMVKNPRSRSRSLGNPTSVARQISFERAIQSLSDQFYVSPILLVCSPIISEFLK